MSTKSTYQPSKRRRSRRHGFLKRMRSPNGRNMITRRRKKGRKILAPKVKRTRKSKR